jgi:FkbM family methyltransferase
MAPLKNLVPKPARQRAKAFLASPDRLRLASDARTFRDIGRLMNSTTRWPSNVDTVPLRLRGLGGLPLHVRPETSDLSVLRDSFLLDGAHLPPDEVDDGPLGLIFDLGAHIGSTAAHLAVLHPEARIVAVELDPDTAAVCRRNLAAFDGRCVLEEGAVWAEDGEVSFESGGADTVSSRAVEGNGPSASRPALSLDTLVERHAGASGRVDYVKMDIEGAERDVLRRNTGWAERVRSIKVEVHPPYTVEECLEDLRALGFRAWVSEPAKPPAMPALSAVRD